MFLLICRIRLFFVTDFSLCFERDAVSENGEHKGIYHKVKTHLGQNGIEDFYIRFQELHVANEIVSC